MATVAEAERPTVFVITGAGNPRIWGSLSPTSFVYHELREISGASEYLVPDFLGMASLDFSYSSLKTVIDKKLTKYPEEQKKVLVGHSLGAAIAARYRAENPDAVSGVVAIAGVFGPVRMGLARNMVERYTRQTEEMLEDLDDPGLYCLGSVHDRVVPVDSALPEMAGDNRVLIHNELNGYRNALSKLVELIPTLSVVREHALLVSHPEVLDEVGRLTNPNRIELVGQVG